FLLLARPSRPTLFPYTTLFRSLRSKEREVLGMDYDEEKIAVAQNLSIRDEGLQYRVGDVSKAPLPAAQAYVFNDVLHYLPKARQDRKSTRLNSSHVKTSYAVFS